MHTDNVIELENVGVKYSKETMQLFSLKDIYMSMFRNWRVKQESKYWWVFRNINLQIKKGDIVAIIGLNGVGKSTLLRAIAGMIECDEGNISLDGKLKLLTPGLGFRDELTGRENIYSGGLILGLTRKQIKEKFDEIVEFAELSHAIDRPFKYFSDGMKARLIFSVATSISPEILMLDELLSAGDISFAEKAAGRMQELIKQAQTIIVVTHSMDFVRKHCTKALYLKDHGVRYWGDPNEAVDLFMSDVNVSKN